MSLVVRSAKAPGCQSAATRDALGSACLSRPRRLAASSGPRNAKPVTFPPGRASEPTRPSATGSPMAGATMGIVVVARCTALAAGGENEVELERDQLVRQA